MGNRGTSLGAVLAIISVGLLAAFTMAASSSLNLQVAQRVENTQTASLLAESAVQTAIAQLMQSGDWQGNVDLPGPEPNSGAQLTFNRTLEVPFSTNNRDGTRPNGWTGSRLLPAGAALAKERVHLVAVGRYRNIQRTVECCVFVPNFTPSIASNGKILLNNSIVASLKNPADLANLATNPELLGPGDLATNANASDAIVLDQNSEVTGNAQSAGGISLRNGSKVGGEVRSPWSGAEELPVFNLAEYDPAATGALNFQTLPPGTVTSQNLSGLVRSSSLNVLGDLRLDNALLYVDGNLDVSGGIKGTGSVMVTQNASVHGGVSLTTDDQVALLCNGDVNLVGDVPDRYEFHGLIYTRGNFTATNFQIVGAFIANGSGPGKGNVSITGSKMYSTPAGAQVPVFYPRQIVLQIAGCNQPDVKTQALSDQNELRYGMWPGATTGSNGPITYDTPREAVQHVNGLDWPYGGGNGDDGPWHWFDTVVMEIKKQNGQFVYELRYNNDTPLPDAAQYPEKFTTQQAVTQRLTQISATMCPDYNDGESPAGPSIYETVQYRLDTFWPAVFSIWQQTPPAGQPIAPNFFFDPNRFLKTQDKIRITARLEY